MSNGETVLLLFSVWKIEAQGQFKKALATLMKRGIFENLKNDWD